MNSQRKRELAHRYKRLTHDYDNRLDIFSCGRTLAEAMDGDLSRWRVEMEAIESEVQAAIAKAKGETK